MLEKLLVQNYLYLINKGLFIDLKYILLYKCVYYIFFLIMIIIMIKMLNI